MKHGRNAAHFPEEHLKSSFSVFRPQRPPPAPTQQPPVAKLHPQPTAVNKQPIAAQRDGGDTEAGRHRGSTANQDEEHFQTSMVHWPLPVTQSTFTTHSELKPSKIHTEHKELEKEDDTEDRQPREDNNLKKLQEEEEFLLAKIRHMTGDSSPVISPRSMKRLVPAPGDIDGDVVENVPEIPSLDRLQEISLTESGGTLGTEDV